VQELSFQQDIEQWHSLVPHNIGIQQARYKQGPYLRLDIPKLIPKHHLFDLPGVCDRHVLYTDADVIFSNKIEVPELAYLKSLLPQDGPFIMYGRQMSLGATPVNTGVILFDAYRLEEEFESILQFGRDDPMQIVNKAFDQGWLNAYFVESPEHRHKIALLPIHWNWKVYWSLEPSSVEDVRIIHFHGNKANDWLWRAAVCDTRETLPNPPLVPLWDRTMCCDRGKTAALSKQLFEFFLPEQDQYC
jgi:hypothetical protein